MMSLRYSRPPLEGRIAVSLGLVSIILITTVLAFYWGTLRFIRITRQVGESHEVIDDIEVLFSLLKDAETGEVVEVNTGDERKRAAFAQRQARAQAELLKLFRGARIDSIQLRTDQPYASALGRFFETREKRRRHG